MNRRSCAFWKQWLKIASTHATICRETICAIPSTMSTLVLLIFVLNKQDLIFPDMVLDLVLMMMVLHSLVLSLLITFNILVGFMTHIIWQCTQLTSMPVGVLPSSDFWLVSHFLHLISDWLAILLSPHLQYKSHTTVTKIHYSHTTRVIFK